MIASELNLNHTTVHQILTEELTMKKIVCEDCSPKPDNHDNAPCHMAISVIEFFAKKRIPVIPQPP
jgi:hypothetical protein